MDHDLRDHLDSLREEMEDWTDDTWLWCLHCERAFQVKDLRKLGPDYYSCKYEDCDGNMIDFHEWNAEKEYYHQGWPDIPQLGKVYPAFNK